MGDWPDWILLVVAVGSFAAAYIMQVYWRETPAGYPSTWQSPTTHSSAEWLTVSCRVFPFATPM